LTQKTKQKINRDSL